MIQPIRHLLCPVDLSELAGEELRYAAALRSAMNCELTTLYVRPASSKPRSTGNAADSHLTLEAFASNVIGHERSIPLLEQGGDPVREILNAAVAVGADVIVMGTHGRTGLQRLLLGSVTERVVRRSPVPVLTVSLHGRTNAQRPFRLATVLCAVDLSEPSEHAVQYAAFIAAAAGARLVLAHSLEWSEEMDTLPLLPRRRCHRPRTTPSLA